mmetsp:Transcript_25297/g.54263  ORF Transcript_25297/g.54263 Transcript_25297/m.54263 type:complete len:250 (+) Transcript_25297:1050-1799(+)
MLFSTFTDDDVNTAAPSSAAPASPPGLGEGAASSLSPPSWLPVAAAAAAVVVVVSAAALRVLESSLNVRTGSLPSAKSLSFSAASTRNGRMASPKVLTPTSRAMASRSGLMLPPSMGKLCHSSLSKICFRASMFCRWYASKKLAQVREMCFLRFVTRLSQKDSPQEMKQWVHSSTWRKCSPSPAEGAERSEAMRPSTCSKRSFRPSLSALWITPMSSTSASLWAAPAPSPSTLSSRLRLSSSAYHWFIW